MTLQPPAVPTFYPGVPVGTVPAEFNNKIRDPLDFLERRVVLRASRAAAWNVNSGLASRYVPLDTASEDPYAGWVSPADLGGGASTTLAAGTAVGAASFTVASAAGLAAGDYVRIGPAGANREYRQIKSVAGTTITPGVPGGATDPLGLAHTLGDAVVEVVSDPSVYTVQAPGWYLAEGVVSLATSVVTVAGQVLIPGISVNESSPLGVGTPAWEGQETFQAAAAVDHYVSGVWEFYANLGDRVRLNFFLSSETAGNIAAGTGIPCRLSLVWSGV